MSGERMFFRPHVAVYALLTIIHIVAWSSFCMAAAPLHGGLPGGSFTGTVTWSVGAEATVAKSDNFWLAFTKPGVVVNKPSNELLDEAVLAVTWQSDPTSFFPTWNITLTSIPELMPKDDQSVVVSQTKSSLVLASTYAPKPGHEYELAVSYDPVTGGLAVRCTDVTSREELMGLGWSVPGGIALAAMMGGAGSGNNPALAVTSLNVNAGFSPIGLTRQYWRKTANGATAMLNSSMSSIDPGDQVALDLTLPAATSGVWSVLLQREDRTEVITRFTGRAGTHTYPIFAGYPQKYLGNSRLLLQYDEGGRVTYSDVLDVRSGRVTLRMGTPQVDQAGRLATTEIQLDSNFPIATSRLTVTADIEELTWDEASHKNIFTRVGSSALVYQGDATSTDGHGNHVPGSFELPPRAGLWRITYHAALDTPPGVNVSVEGSPVIIDTDIPSTQFSVATYNLWAGEEWPRREPALRAVIQAMQPDILCVQELRPATRYVLDEILPHHQRVQDSFYGWLAEGNIFWNTEKFELVEYGAENVGILEPWRRLFWVRLRTKQDGRTLLVTTAHFTWGGHPTILAEGIGPRLEQARRTVDALQRLARPDEPVLFMGDLNDAGEAVGILRASGLQDSFNSRGLTPPPTHPADPKQAGGSSYLDWQLHRGSIRVLTSEVVTFFDKGIAPSDHKPVLVTYGM